MAAEKKGTDQSTDSPMTIIILDPESGAGKEYKVHPRVAKAFQAILEGDENKGPSWDSACRL